MNASEIESLVRGFLKDTLGLDPARVASDTALVTSGLVDSVGLVRLAALLERSLGLRIPDRDIVAEHFDSLEAITAYVRKRMD